MPNAVDGVAGADAAGTRADRIRRATARGPLAGHLPAAYEDEDWVSVKSADPFEVLYLDPRQPGAIGPAVLDDRRQTLFAFWKQKDDVRNRNAGGQRDRIDRKYGFDVGTYAGLVDRAYRRLAEPGAVAREAQALDDARRREAEAKLRPVLRSGLADGLLTVEETETLLQEGEAVGLSREETADYLSRVLAERKFTAREAARGATLSAVLLSTEWINAERRARDDAAAARAAERARTWDVPPLKFREGAARTLEELLDLCDRYPDEAARYLADGVLEPWLAGAAGEAAVASTARRLRSSFPTMQRHTLELFARSLAGPLGRPSVPVLTAHPSECVFGPMPQGALRSMRVEFSREGRPFVWGTARIEHAGPGVTVSRTFEDDATGRPPFVEVTVDTVDISPGEYGTTIIVEPAGGARLTVPVRFTVVPLALTPDQPAVDLGTIPFGQTRSVTVHVGASPNGGRLIGSVALGEARNGVTLAGGVRDEGAEAVFTVDSRVTGPGVQYRSALLFETNAGSVRVPVTFRVRRAGAEAQKWAIGGAAVGGAAMWAARDLLLPGDRWHLTYSWLSHAPSVAIAGLTLWVVGRVAGGIVRRVAKR
ncbi:MAG TPA: hypothetical protein VGD56_03600 [Gemmatirosa sp.]